MTVPEEEKREKVSKEEVFKIYDQLMRLAINEDRLASERNSIFLLANSFLVMGFMMSLGYAFALRYILASVGIFLCLLQLSNLWVTWLTYRYWSEGLEKVESFNLSKRCWTARDQHLAPYTARKRYYEEHRCRWLINWVGAEQISKWYIPSLFLITWILLLIFGFRVVPF